MSEKPSPLRRKYMINLKFQLIMIGSMVFVALAFVVFWYISQRMFFGRFDELAAAYGIDATHPFMIFIAAQKKTLFNVFLFLMGANILFVYLWGLFLSHRIAGPIYRINRSLNDILEGKEMGDIKVRKNDYFQDLPENINKVIAKLRNKME